jgi:outer membrane protein
MRDYALENNISVKQTELLNLLVLIKKSDREFLPSLNANASHSWNIGLNQDITTGLLVKQRSLHQREQVLELIFIKVYRIKTH